MRTIDITLSLYLLMDGGKCCVGVAAAMEAE